jgi:hypothetical protein
MGWLERVGTILDRLVPAPIRVRLFPKPKPAPPVTVHLEIDFGDITVVNRDSDPDGLTFLWREVTSLQAWGDGTGNGATKVSAPGVAQLSPTAPRVTLEVPCEPGVINLVIQANATIKGSIGSASAGAMVDWWNPPVANPLNAIPTGQGVHQVVWDGKAGHSMRVTVIGVLNEAKLTAWLDTTSFVLY